MVLKTGGAGTLAGGGTGAEETGPPGRLVGTGGGMTTTEEDTGPLGLPVGVVGGGTTTTTDEDGGAGLVVGYLGGLVSEAVTGQTVVYSETMSVVTWPTGQLVTVGAQEVTVYTEVAYTVEVVYPVCALTAAAAPRRVIMEAFIFEIVWWKK